MIGKHVAYPKQLDPPTTLNRVLIVRLAAAAIAVALPIILPLTTDDIALQTVTPLFVLTLSLQLLPLFWSRKPDLFSPLVYGGIYGALATISMLASLYVLGRLDLTVVRGLTIGELVALTEKTLYAGIVALLAYYLGYFNRRAVKWRRMFPNVSGIAWSPRRLLIASVAMGLIFGFCYLYFQLQVGVDLFEVRRLDAGKDVWRSRPELSWMLRGIELGFLPVLLYFAQRLSEKKVLRLVPAILFAGIAFLLILRVGQRGRIFFVAIVCCMLVHYMRRRIPALLFAAGIFISVPVSNTMHGWRTSSYVRANPVGAETDGPIGEFAAHEGDRSRLGALAIIMDAFPNKHDYLLGESWLAVAVVPIPRWLWPQKDEAFLWRDSRMVDTLGGGKMPAPLHAVLYANFSWPGIFFGMFLWGMFHRALYEWLRQNSRDKNTVLLYATTLLFFSPTLLGISATIQMVIPLYILLRLIGQRVRPSGSENPAPMSPAMART